MTPLPNKGIKRTATQLARPGPEQNKCMAPVRYDSRKGEARPKVGEKRKTDGRRSSSSRPADAGESIGPEST